eukprot:498646-Pleurochrysis_carterae.AAC.1
MEVGVDTPAATHVLTHLLPVSDAADTRATISKYPTSIGFHPLDLRTKDEGRISMDKFYDGGTWHQFICRGGKSPGGSVIIAKPVLIVANYYENVAAAEQAKAA